jgi:undecaprenyl-diphosphatase
MPELLKAAILGTVQGLTEFLPVSSTGHLILLEKALNVNQDTFGLTFDAAIHLGTLLSILILLRHEVLRLATGWLGSLRSLLPGEQARRVEGNDDARLAWLIIIGTAPAAVLGVFLESTVEDAFRRPALVASTLIAFSAVLALAEWLSSKRRSMAELGIPGTLFIGFAQAVALVPGVSRSGITMSAGLFAGLQRRQAALFAFLLSAPVIAGAGLKKLYDVFDEVRAGGLDASDLRFFAVGFVLSAIWGAVAIAFLLRFLQRNPLYVFVWYRLALGLTVLGILAAT